MHGTKHFATISPFKPAKEFPVKRMQLVLILATALAVALGGCSRQNTTDQPKAAKPAQPYEAVAAQGKGFTVGAMMSANTVYVMFDPQCPHCGHLW